MKGASMRTFGRREFLHGFTVAGAASLLGAHLAPANAEPPPETTTLRIADRRPGICIAPQYVAADLLRGEGFTDVKYLLKATFAERLQALATGDAQMTVAFVSSLISRVDAGDPIIVLAGSHVGCFELFGTERVRAIRDLKGKRVAVNSLQVISKPAGWSIITP
jgi:NitT/TauT family transport system substrate-binding protein